MSNTPVIPPATADATAVTPAVLDKVILLLVPLFLAGTGGDRVASRHAVSQLLADYNAETQEELRLAAAIISFGFGALDALAQSMDENLSLNDKLRLRSSANAQHRSANQCQKTLDQLRRQRHAAQEDTPAADVTELEASIQSLAAAVLNPAPAHPANAQPANAQPAHAQPAHAQQMPAQPAPALSRQQRRAADRKAEKRLRRQQQTARLDALRATRHDHAADDRPDTHPASPQNVAA